MPPKSKSKVKADPRRIEYLPLDKIKADPRNPREHDEETIGASIGRFGVLDLITMDDRTGFMVSGHGRRKTYARMEEQGESPPEGVKVAEDGTWLIPVAVGWASRSDMEARAALIALNRTTELGGWVDDELLSLLSELEEEGDGLDGVGFTQEDMDRLLLKADEALSDLPDGYEGANLGGQDSEGISSYTMVFDGPEELREWQEFLRWLNKRSDDRDTMITDLVLEYVKEGEFGDADTSE